MSEHDHSTRFNVYRFIESYYARHGQSPTYREITSGVPLSSVDNAHYHVDYLVEEGYLVRVPVRARNIRLTDKRYLHELPGDYVRTRY